MSYWVFIIVIVPVHVSFANFDAGKNAATQSVTVTASLTTLDTVKSTGIVASETPPEASLENKDTLQRASDHVRQTNESLQIINKSQEGRQDYLVDVDASLKKASSGSDDGTLGTSSTELKGQPITKTCWRSGMSYTQTCKRERIVVLEVIPERGHYNPRFCLGHWNRWGTSKSYCGGCRGGEYVIDQHKQVIIKRDAWVGCETEESLRDAGGAELEDVHAGAIENPRYIQGEPVAGDIWEETRRYKIGPASFDHCAALTALGCVDQGGTCIESKTISWGRTICLVYEHKLQCPTGKTTIRSPKNLSIPSSEPPSYESNKNMVEALSRIEALKQASKSMETGYGSVVSVFKGDAKRCTTNFGGAFKDCCKTNGGIGVRLHLATQCTAGERELMDWKSQGRCVFVGQRQTKNTFGMNVSKDYVYCCFPSKLSRTIQEGARKQLGISFGTAASPSCRGLTPSELQRVDFSRLDLSEVFAEMVAAAQKTAETLKTDFAQKQQALSGDTEKQRRKLMQEQSTTAGHHDLIY